MAQNPNKPQSQADAELSPRRRAERTFYRFMNQAFDAFSKQMAVEAENIQADADYKVPELIGMCQVAYPEKYRRFKESPTGLYIFFFLKNGASLTLQVGHKETDGMQQALGDTPALTGEEVIVEIENMIFSSLEGA